MKFLAISTFTLCSMLCHAEKEIRLDEVKDYIGDSVIVEDKISGVRFLEKANHTPTFSSVGAPYPNKLLTIVIWGDVRSNLPVAPSPKDVGNKVCVPGKVELYRGKPQIVIKDARQIDIIQDAQKEVE